MIVNGKPAAPMKAAAPKVEQPKKLIEIKKSDSTSITNKIVEGNIQKAV